MADEDVAYMVTAREVSNGLFRKKIVITITDGYDEWKFDHAESFTIKELKRRFPYFNRKESSWSELTLTATAYRDVGGQEFTQVTASCPCGRGGWIRLEKHPEPKEHK